MGRILRVKVNWTGFVGSPGYTNFHFEPVPESDPVTQATVDAAVAKVQAFITSVKGNLPPVVSTGIDAAVAEIDEVTGDIQTFWNAVVTAPAPGTMAGVYAAGTGCCISWSTGGVRNGRRVRGRTFIVPLSGGAFATDGTIDTGSLASIRTAATTLTTDSNGVRLVIWAKTPGAIIPDGGAYDVIGATVNDKAAFLSSRRD
jgi:hypothetical protein